MMTDAGPSPAPERSKFVYVLDPMLTKNEIFVVKYAIKLNIK